MIRRASAILAPAVLLLGCNADLTTPAQPLAETSPQFAQVAERGRDFPGVVYVRSQGLFYQTFVSAQTLPMRGPFQLLVPPADGAPAMTEYGPGDPGYVGGRWWVDVNGDGEQNEGDAFFLCPLIPPGQPISP